MARSPFSALDKETIGLVYGFLGVLCFSLTLPATRAAVADLDPVIVGLGRSMVAAMLAAILLRISDQKTPSRRQIKSLIVVALGVVIGFPILSAWAMVNLPASHGAIVLGIAPLATAISGTLRTGDRPSIGFWLASILGSATVVSFAVYSGAGHLQIGDLALLGAMIAASFGYAEGALLAQVMGGWQVISWGLIVAVPMMILPVIAAVWQHGLVASPTAWLGFGYIAVFSQFLAFFAWYKGLAIGGVARVGQVQLLQPFLTIAASALLLGESISPVAIGTAIVVLMIVILGKKAAVKRVK
ncbi:DMT family transporter [Chlorogloea sp. CCALA 695]|uniref:DMT family transporter n=1 Tax=Chlorogloea sp. CCALA 695 TaxID=2107693 RepID=UPI000D056D08|nr:DMT family transporter [Chlorogloea sp. CCALA 695]PSB35461.1 EamA family transporter [Chlorogloea sp. CCALA 695]